LQRIVLYMKYHILSSVFLQMYKFIFYVNNSDEGVDKMLDKICLILSILGSVNWGLVGIFQFDLVAWLFGGQDALVSRIIYTVIALAGIWCISLLFRDNGRNHE
jgi:uncharacterized membrane protein YuzA (DUF378 family)